ncbi:MAG TPA: DEAD/DEAH box helicase, partial [Steroidobacteraceae bacterium]|nr:DEAD/DEAH box helicase [Steroidobacteraceae bacterium]
SGFHPAVAGWFRRRFPGGPTEAQARAWAVTSQHRNTLIAAPTGSGKTLAAFLSAINDLVVEGLTRGLSDEVHVLYVSPLKALSNDIQKNLQEPLAGIRDQLLEQGLPDVPIRDAVRTGDTSALDRNRMRRTPPHILVTTPESLFILLTSESGRAMLKSVRSVIVDELHSVAGSKRGSHLTLSLERLEALCGRSPVRVGLSATVKPLDEMARFLVGTREADVEIVDTGHVRERDLALELPRSPLDAVMANEVWDELYDRLAELIKAHKTTLIFVNNRRLAERATRFLAERVGAEAIATHHGSLSKEHRLKAEQRLKHGELRALIATSSLELGIDIGDIDLVCQMGSPRMISALLQRVGRAGHAVDATPKGRLFPLSLDDLVECTALLDSVRRGELDRIRVPVKPLDVLSQQIVAEVASREWGVEELLAMLRRARPYADLTAKEFEQILQMLSEGYSTRRGRRSAYLHYDTVNRRLRARRGARLTAVTNAGVIPDQFDYDVVLNPEGLRIGSIGEDFAFESIPGDIFQLGNASYKIQKVEVNKVFVEDAKGAPPTIPFWFGEAPARSDELSASVSRLREQALVHLAGGPEACEQWLREDLGLAPAASHQLAQYLAAGMAALGTLPTLDTVVFERFFDDVCDTHLVIHSTFGSRINRAWGLALRKRFCRQFNFELQASALEDSIVLSLGPTHSFPLEDVKGFLKSATARDVLVQALLDAPMFGTRWRWNAAVALAVRRMRNGKRVPPQFQRSDSEDLLAVVFPDQLACAENLTGTRQIPDHPLVRQTIDDCLHETMDVDGFLALLKQVEDGAVEVRCRDLSGPSPLAHAVIGAKPYAFLDDGNAEERRTRAITTQRLLEPKDATDLGRLDPAAIERVRAEAWPEIGNHDELHDALVVHGFLTAQEIGPWKALLARLQEERRVVSRKGLWLAVERSAEFDGAKTGDLEALVEILRNRLELLGPVTEATLNAPLDLSESQIRAALLALEAQGSVMRGRFTGNEEQWCERRLLLRIHRYTRDRKRSEIQTVPPAQLMRFLFRWQQLALEGRDDRREGEAGLLAVLKQLEGCAVPAAAWERDILPLRIRNYLPQSLDKLCAAGRIAWYRAVEASNSDLAPASAPVRSTPITLVERESLAHWQKRAATPLVSDDGLSPRAQKILDSLREHGASFFSDLLQDTGLLRTEVELGLGELVSRGRVSSDSFAGLRALITSMRRREKLRRYRRPLTSVDDAGRWSLPRRLAVPPSAEALGDPAVDHIARVLLRRYGVVFRKLLERESGLPPWRELFYVYRRMEARGEIRGGRFISGFAGEQFALPEAADLLRSVSRDAAVDRVSISAADPLNLAGIVTPGDRVPALSGNRVLFEQGVPVAVQAGGEVRFLKEVPEKSQWEIRNLLIRRQGPEAYLPGTASSH